MSLERPMDSNSTDPAQLTSSIEALRREMAQLAERTQSLETQLQQKLREAAQQSQPGSGMGTLNEGLVLAISAAVAAYLGVKPHIREIRLQRGSRWVQEGRVTIQASHALTRHRG